MSRISAFTHRNITGEIEGAKLEGSFANTVHFCCSSVSLSNDSCVYPISVTGQIYSKVLSA